MAKITYTATDAAGIVHKRTTATRAYSHTVVVKGGYETHLTYASHKDWAKGDSSNFAYYTAIAEGRSRHFPSTRYRAQDPKRWTAVEIAEEEATCAKRDADAHREAVRKIDGHTLESYVNTQRLARIRAIEEKKAAGGYDVWNNVGWCGRLDLAHGLATKWSGKGYDVAILEAQEA